MSGKGSFFVPSAGGSGAARKPSVGRTIQPAVQMISAADQSWGPDEGGGDDDVPFDGDSEPDAEGDCRPPARF